MKPIICVKFVRVPMLILLISTDRVIVHIGSKNLSYQRYIGCSLSFPEVLKFLLHQFRLYFMKKYPFSGCFMC